MNTELRNQLIWAFYLPTILMEIGLALLIPVMPLFAGNLTAAYSLIGIILAADSIGRVFGDIPASMLIRRFSIKRAALIGLFVTGIPMVLVTFSQNVWIITFLLFASGVGLASYNIARHTYISEVITIEKRGRAIALFGGVFRIGKLIGTIIGGISAEFLGLRAVFPIFGLFAILSIFCVWFFMKADARAKTEHEEESHPDIIETVRSNSDMLLRGGAGQILAQLTRIGWRVLIPLYAADVLGLSVSTIGLIVSVNAAMDVLTFYFSGVIMDRFGRKWAIVPAFVLQTAGVILILFTGGAFGLAFVSGLIGFANGLSSGTMMTLGADLAPSHARGEFLSVWRLIGDVGALSGPLVIGFVAQAFTLQFSVMTIAGTGVGTVLVFGLLVPETLKRKHKRRAYAPASAD